MLVYFLALLTFIIWVTLYGIYFREQITAWFVNRFEKDRTPPSDDASAQPAEPLNYDLHSQNE